MAQPRAAKAMDLWNVGSPLDGDVQWIMAANT
jgi:hypothetical protein